MKYIIALLLVLILISGCVGPKTTLPKGEDIIEPQKQEEAPKEPQEDKTLGLSTQEELFEVIRNSVDDHLKK